MIYLLAAVLLIVTIVLIVYVLLYRRQMREICRQLSFFLEEESNLMIHSSVALGGMGELTSALNDLLMKRRAERAAYRKKERAIADVYTNLSHDIRTPLTSLDGYVQLLSESSETKEKERYLQIIRERIDCLKEMLEELFTFTRLKNDAWKLECTRCSFNRLVGETLLSYYDEWKKQGIDPKILLPTEECFFIGNAASFKRSLQNILKNVLEHGEKELQIEARQEEGVIVLEIGNLVPKGITIDCLQVFERFYKADGARSKTSTGLGLSIAREFILRMKGTIEAIQREQWFFIILRLPLEESSLKEGDVT